MQKLPEDVIQTGVEKAIGARENAYNPYSEYSVGACVVVETMYADTDEDYVFFTGANIENVNFTNTTHAEQLAIDTAVVNGYRNMSALIVATADGDENGPCGLCQQHFIEFASKETPVYIQTTGTEYICRELQDCTPFDPAEL